MTFLQFRVSKSLRTVKTVILIMLVAFMSGCGDNNLFESLADDGSKEAKTEAALMAMDDGDYERARNILLPLIDSNPDDARLLQYLGSAYSGLAGLDTLNLLEILDELEESNKDGSIDMIGLILGDAAGLLTTGQVAIKLDHMEKAISALNRITLLNRDQIIQRGLFGLTQVSLLLADMIMMDLDVENVVLTESGISTLYVGRQADFSAASDETIEKINTYLDYLADAVAELQSISDGDNDLAEDFAKFLSDIDPDGNGVTRIDLQEYIDNL